MRQMQIFGLIIIALTFIASALLYGSMPERMASHWGLEGQVNGYIGKPFGLFLIPIIALVIFLFMVALPGLDPLRRNYDAFINEYDILCTGIAAFLCYLHVLTLAFNLGYQFDLIRLLAPAFGVMLFGLGMIMKKVKRNWFVGIRTPWTISSDGVWDRTHAICGSMFMVDGVIALIGIVLPVIGLLLAIVIAVAIAVFGIVFSYLEYSKEQPPRVKKAQA